MIYRFDTLTSTNDEARNPRYAHGDIIVAEYQTEGRGQRGNRWASDAGKNLMFSVVLAPENLAVAAQFSLLECVALALVDTFTHFQIDTTIKWTNDIYVGDSKLVGILMEHKLQGAVIGRTIAGIGLNVNQTEFDPELPNPTSMRLIAGREFDRKEVLERIALHLKNRYEMLRRGEIKQLHLDYHQRLYRLGEEHTYALPDGTRFRGVIEGVEPQGALKITTLQGEAYKFLFKEVEFVLKN